MARTGGRNTGFAWFAGIVSAVVIVALVWFAAPAFPAVAVWVGGMFRGAIPAAEAPEAQADADPLATPTAEPGGSERTPPTDCTALYPETLRALLSTTAGAEFVEAAPVPESAVAVAAAIGVADPLVCTWRIPNGASVTTVVGPAGPDAANLLAAALGSEQFACTSDGVSAHCAREQDGRVEVYDTGSGLWSMSLEEGWHPPDYAESIAAQIWG